MNAMSVIDWTRWGRPVCACDVEKHHFARLGSPAKIDNVELSGAVDPQEDRLSARTLDRASLK